ncbi:MAG: hypothetical protein JSR61_18385 [Proteobacteria bacterium]|nr:hypothetical protein [Pseudomonadota bacterium]
MLGTDGFDGIIAMAPRPGESLVTLRDRALPMKVLDSLDMQLFVRPKETPAA